MEEELVAPTGEKINTGRAMKAISFSLWGDKEEYIAPLLQNLELARQHFPGWTIVVYADERVEVRVLDALREGGARVILAGRSNDTRGAFWRYRALSLPGLEAVIFRDSDSLLTARDAAMVHRWMASDLPLLVCRDHPNQVAPISGGLWGARGELLPVLQALVEKTDGPHSYGDDEKFLVGSVYRPYRDRMMIFSPFFRYRGERVEEEPVERQGAADYLGRREMSPWTVYDDALMADALRHAGGKRPVWWFVPGTLACRVARFVWEKRLDWRYARYFVFRLRIWKKQRPYWQALAASQKMAPGEDGKGD